MELTAGRTRGETLNSAEKKRAMDSEESVIGAMMLSPEALQYAASNLKTEELFFSHHRNVFRVLLEMSSKGKDIDYKTVVEELQTVRGELESMADEYYEKYYIEALPDTCPNPFNIRSYCRFVREFSNTRKVRELGERLLSTSDTGLSPDELMAEARRILETGTDEIVGQEIKSVSDIVDDYQDKLIKRITGPEGISGLSTGFDHLDNLTNGFHCPSITLVGGTPGSGKTSLLVQMSQQVVKANKVPVLYYSLEHSTEFLLNKTTSRLTNINNRKIVRNGAFGPFDPEVDKVRSELEKFKNDIASHLYLHGSRDGFDFTEAENEAKYLMRKHNVESCLVIIDSLHNLTPSSKTISEYETINLVIDHLITLNSNLNSPVVGVSQFARSAYDAKGRNDVMRGFRGSGRLEYCADLAMVLETRQATWNENPRDVKLVVAKNRMDREGKIYFRFHTDTSAFVETDVPWPEDEEA